MFALKAPIRMPGSGWLSTWHLVRVFCSAPLLAASRLWFFDLFTWRNVMKSKTASGAHWEGVAERHLRRHGLSLLGRNYRCKGGEIDLIMRTNDQTIVFVEVRYRRSSAYGTPLETVGVAKQARIRTAAKHYIQRQAAANSPDSYRFDVVGISGNIHAPKLEWIQAAFY